MKMKTFLVYRNKDNGSLSKIIYMKKCSANNRGKVAWLPKAKKHL